MDLLDGYIENINKYWEWSFEDLDTDMLVI